MKTLWTNEYLSDLATEAEVQISTQVSCIYVRFPLNIVASQSIYDFTEDTSPSQRLTGIIRITWQGYTVYPVFQAELRNVIVPLKPTEGDVESSRPFLYCRLGYGMDKIKFFACPNTTIAYDSSNINTKTGIRANVIVSGWRIADPAIAAYRVPDYVRETLVRYYVLSKAFKREGKGQNLIASNYYEVEYEKLLKRFRKITDNLYSSRMRGIKEGLIANRGVRPPRPRLPANFGESR